MNDKIDKFSLYMRVFLAVLSIFSFVGVLLDKSYATVMFFMIPITWVSGRILVEGGEALRILSENRAKSMSQDSADKKDDGDSK